MKSITEPKLEYYQAKDLALITTIIIHEDILGATLFHTFDQAWEYAKEFQKHYAHDFDWINQENDFDEAIIKFVNTKIL